MTQTGAGFQAHYRKAFGSAARAAGILVTCGCVLVAAACGREPSPIAPGGPPGVGPSPSPTGESHIRGLVNDRVQRPVAGALIAVLDGPLAGTTKLTDAAGKFEVTGGAAGTVTLRVSHDDFEPSTRALSWQPLTSTGAVEVIFSLDTLEPPIALDAGDYTLTIAIDLKTAKDHPGIPQAPCAGFPVELASRTYLATIKQAASPYERIVSAENRPLHFETLFGFSLAGRFVGFEMDYGIPEDFSGFRFLNIIGIAPTAEPAITAGSSISVPFHGEFRYCQLKSARGRYNDCSQVPVEQIVNYHSCTSDHSTMVFTRR